MILTSFYLGLNAFATTLFADKAFAVFCAVLNKAVLDKRDIEYSNKDHPMFKTMSQCANLFLAKATAK